MIAPSRVATEPMAATSPMPPIPPVPPIPGTQRHFIDWAGLRLALHVSIPEQALPPSAERTPLLLVHSVNAAASAAEWRPFAVRQAARRPVVALDLPGFGDSQRGDLPYTPPLMAQAVLGALSWMREQRFALDSRGEPVADVVALSLGCEFAAMAVAEQPRWVRTLAFVSPTGLEGKHAHERLEPAGDGQGAYRSREQRWLKALLRQPWIGQPLFDALTSRASMRWFLGRTFGSKDIDETLFEHSHASARAPGARFAPLAFVAGSLFTRGVARLYEQLPVPLWVAHGTRGSFADFDAFSASARRARSAWQREMFASGAMPQFQQLDGFRGAYERFLSRTAWNLSQRSGDSLRRAA